MKNAESILVTGTSAGGLATFTWADYITDLLKSINPNCKVSAAPDSGM